MGQVVSQRELLLRRGEWKKTGEGVVCAYGAFDLLHPGHVRLLEQARDLGSILAVGVQSDDLVRSAARLEGQCGTGANAQVRRPITPVAERAEILAALGAVDIAAVVDRPLAEFLKLFRPDVFVCGDAAPKNSRVFRKARESVAEVERATWSDLDRTIAAIGCRLVRLPVEPGYSTSSLMARISGETA